MCGIVCAFNIKQPVDELRPQILNLSKKIRHRGPDWSGIYSNDNAILAHERLAIQEFSVKKTPAAFVVWPKGWSKRCTFFDWNGNRPKLLAADKIVEELKKNSSPATQSPE